MLTRADVQQRVLAPAAVHHRLAAVGVDTAVMLLAVVPCGLLAVCARAALSFYLPRTSHDPALFGWLFFSALGTACTLYYCRDIFGGGRPAGVCVLRLFVDAGNDYESDERAVRCVRVWLLLNKAPVIVFTATCWVGLIYTFFGTIHSFTRRGGGSWPPALIVGPALVFLALSAISLLFALGPDRRSLFDRLLGVRVLRPTFLQPGGVRGFALEARAEPVAVGDRAMSEYPPATR
jgi:hypothetical protein